MAIVPAGMLRRLNFAKSSGKVFTMASKELAETSIITADRMWIVAKNIGIRTSIVPYVKTTGKAIAADTKWPCIT